MMSTTPVSSGGLDTAPHLSPISEPFGCPIPLWDSCSSLPYPFWPSSKYSATTTTAGGAFSISKSSSLLPSSTAAPSMVTSSLAHLPPISCTSCTSQIAFSTPDTSYPSSAAPPTIAPVSVSSSSLQTPSVSTKASSGEATTPSPTTSSRLQSSEESSVSQFSCDSSSSSQRSATSVSTIRPASATLEATERGRAVQRLPLIVGISVGATLLVILGLLMFYVRHGRLASSRHRTGCECPVSDPSSNFKSDDTLIEGHEHASTAARTAGSDREPENGSSVQPSAIGQPATDPGASDHLAGGLKAYLHEDLPLSGADSTAFDRFDEDSDWRCHSTPLAHARTQFTHWLSASSSLSPTHARPFGPRPPLISYAQLYGDHDDTALARSRREKGGMLPKRAEDGGISLAGGPLREAEGPHSECDSAASELDMGVDSSSTKSRGSATSDSRTLPPPYQEP